MRVIRLVSRLRILTLREILMRRLNVDELWIRKTNAVIVQNKNEKTSTGWVGI